MESLRKTQKKYCSTAMITAVFLAFFFIIIEQKPVGKGLILGTIFSVINFILMAETLPMRIGKSKKKTFFISLGSIFFRYIILAIPLVTAIKSDQFNLVSVVAGIFSIQVVLIVEHLFNLISLSHKKQI